MILNLSNLGQSFLTGPLGVDPVQLFFPQFNMSLAHFIFYYIWYTRLFVETEPTYHTQFIDQILLNDPDEEFLSKVENAVPTKFTTFLTKNKQRR